MAEISYLWTDSLGDGGPYSQDFLRSWSKALTLEPGANAGVFRGELTDLLIQSTGNNNIHVRTGRALVNGTFYENGTIFDITTASPAVGTTGRRVVLQKVWSTRTVRCVVITSADGTAGLPALTQTSGTLWEIPLYSFTITTGGIIGSLTDERVYLPAPDAQRERYFPVTGGTTMTTGTGTAFGTHPGAQLSNGSTTYGWIGFRVPFDFVTLVACVIDTVTTATGNIQRQIDSQYGAVGENPSTANTGSIAAGTRSMTANILNEESLTSILGSLAAGDLVGIQYQRVGADAADVNTGTTQVLGVNLTYKIT